MEIASSAFENNDAMPLRYGHAYDNTSPPLNFSDIPEGARSLALIMDDPDAVGGTFTHWVVYNIPPLETQLEEDEIPEGALQGVSDYGKKGYGGPQPPSGTHRYFFKLYALDSEIDLEEGATSEELQEAMEGHVVASAELVGLFSAGGEQQ